jgi:hypothetical protein
MENFVKILVLDNEFEAEILDEVLNDRQIPHGIVSFSDSVMEGIVQMEYGWGYVEAPLSFREEITSIYGEIKKE